METISGIYEIRNINNGHCYIGSSVDVAKRWRKHKLYLTRSEHHSKHLQSAWNCYGADSFRFKVIEECDKGQLVQREQYYIDLLKPEYNILPNADSALGAKRSSETRSKISSVLMGHKYNLGHVTSQETRAKISQAEKGRKGKPVTPEMRARISAALKGRIKSPETCKKLSESKKGKKLSEEQRAKLILANTGRKPSQETRDKMSASHKNPSQETRTKMSAVLIGNTRTLGYKHSPETRAKMSASHRARIDKIKNGGIVASD